MRPWLKVALALATLSAASAQQATSGIFEGRGVVKEVHPGTGVLTTAHAAIKGFMPAMEMMYRVETPALGKDAHPGDLKIDTAKLVIVEVTVVGHGK